MTRFEVWAPRARRVELVLGRELLPMERVERARFAVDVPGAVRGTTYAFSLDGGPPRPDPRSPRQPSGVHDASHVVDHMAFAWRDEDWAGADLATAVLYELPVGTFTPAGTFDGVVERLDHLVSLGVTAVELMPVASFPGRWGWGYDGVGLYAPHEAYGGPHGLKRLVDACHARGLAVVLDVVYNHLGPSGNYLAEFGPYVTDRHRTPWGDAVNLDGPGSDEVRRFLLDNAAMWLRDYHIDGLRLDAVDALFDSSATHFLGEIAAMVRHLEVETGRRFWVIGESDLNDPRLMRAPETGGYGLDATWSDDFHHALHVALTGERSGYYADFVPEDLATAQRCGYVYQGQYSRCRDRRHGRPLGDVPLHRLLGYAQNHDQVGNHAAGERLCHLITVDAAQEAAALVLRSPFVPLLFMGEEWAASTPFLYFADHDDPEIAAAVAEGRRRELEAFDWPADGVPDPGDPATFERSKLRWDELTRPGHEEMLAWYRSLIAERRRTHRSVGHCGSQETVMTDRTGWES